LLIKFFEEKGTMNNTNVTEILSSTNYLTNRLPDEILLIISSFAGTAIAHLSSTSKEVHLRIKEMADYFMSVRHESIVPLDTTSLTSTILCLTPMYFKNWGFNRSTVEKELLFGEAVRSGSINTMKHLISIGADVNAIRLTVPNDEHPENSRGDQYFPIQDAVSYNHPEKLRLLLDCGADLSPMYTYGRRFIMDGYEDLLTYTSDIRFGKETNEEIPEILLNEHIKRREFHPFFMRVWRSDPRIFQWFCKALSSITRGLKSGYASNCDNSLCGEWCRNVRFCNGRMLCGKCTESNCGPAKESINQGNYVDTLWRPPVLFVDYPYDPFENGEEDYDTVGTWDPNFNDDEFFDSDDGEDGDVYYDEY
jgi:hypothetical protein